MRRPALFLWCKIKADSLPRPIVVPVPLFLVEDLLHAAFALMRMGGKWVSWQQKLGQYGDLIQQALRELPRLVQELRYAGPFTLVEVFDPEEGVEVALKLV